MVAFETRNWWRTPLQIFSEITGLIVVPIVAALYLGKWLDKKYNSEPWLTVITVCIGITMAVIFVYRIAYKYIREIEKEARKVKYHNDHSSRDTSS